MRSPLSEIYSQLMLGKTVKVSVADKSEYETLRTSLHRHNKLVKEISDEGFSLQATLVGSEALFRLGPDRRIKHKYTFQVLEDDAQIPSSLG